MVTTSSSSSSNPNNSKGAFTTIKERATFEKEIKKSKFIAIAGHIPDERSAQSFLSEVPFCVKIESLHLFRSWNWNVEFVFEDSCLVWLYFCNT